MVRRHTGTTAVLLTAAVLLIAGCGKKTGGDLGSTTGKVAGIEWKVPAQWTAGPEKPMRIVTYNVPAAEGDAEGGECYVSHFGSGQGGVVDANIERWVGQFENPDAPAKSSRDVNGINVTIVQLAGSFLGSGGMGMGMGSPHPTPKPNYRLLAAILEAPHGTVFFKMTGPAKTVAAAEGDFNAMINSLTK